VAGNFHLAGTAPRPKAAIGIATIAYAILAVSISDKGFGMMARLTLIV